MDREMAGSGWEGMGGIKGTERQEGLKGEGRDKSYIVQKRDWKRRGGIKGTQT